MKRPVSGFFAGLFLVLSALPLAHASEPRFPLIINEDNSHFFGSRGPEEMTLEGLHAFVDQYAGTAVTHLFLCPNSMKTSYDSAVWDAMWELGSQKPPEDDFARKWLENARLLHERGLDPYAIWIARCREKGISPWLSMRMNDIHNVDDTTHYIHGSFWVDHPEYWRVPHAEKGFFERALDYGQEPVRAHHLALVRELLQRYDPDGLELDWMRFGWHFAPGKEAEGAKVLTEFMREVRALAEEAAKRRGHPIKISARVPAHPDAARGLGMDAVRWGKEGLIDMLVPCPFWASSDFDIPLERWHELLGEAGDQVLLVPGMEILLRAYPGGPQIESDLAAVYGFAATASHRGAEGHYLFNYMDPAPMLGGTKAYRNLLEKGLQAAGAGAQRIPVTFRDTVPAGFDDNAQLPLSLDAPAQLRVYAGAIPPDSQVSLLLGAVETAEDMEISVTLNDNACTLLDRPAQPDNTPLATWLRISCPAQAIQTGYNTFRLEQTEGAPLRIVWAELQIQPQ